jgi:hypothetical protein
VRFLRSFCRPFARPPSRGVKSHIIGTPAAQKLHVRNAQVCAVAGPNKYAEHATAVLGTRVAAGERIRRLGP